MALHFPFFTKGRLYDKDGNIGGQLWDDKTEASFTEKTECMINQYSSYEIEEINQNVSCLTVMNLVVGEKLRKDNF